MGYCHSRLGMGKKAVVNYNVALRLNPADVSSQGLLAEVKKSLLSAGETVETIEALEVTKADEMGGVRPSLPAFACSLCAEL